MKRLSILTVPILLTSLLSGNAISQQKPNGDISIAVADTSVVYSYDAAGNRIKKKIRVTSSKVMSLEPDSLTTSSDTLNLKLP